MVYKQLDLDHNLDQTKEKLYQSKPSYAEILRIVLCHTNTVEWLETSKIAKNQVFSEGLRI